MSHRHHLNTRYLARLCDVLKATGGVDMAKVSLVQDRLRDLFRANPAVSLSRPKPVTTRSGDRGVTTPSAAAGVGVAVRASQNVSSSTANLRGGGDIASPTTDKELKSYASEASGLFGILRVPAALFAGASAGAAFAMPTATASAMLTATASAEGLKIGLAKRLYAPLMISCLASQIIVVVVSTLTMGALTLGFAHKTKSVGDLLDREYSLEWTAVQFFFLAGLGCFAIGSGLRAWVTIACPIFSKASLGMIISATLLCLAFVRDTSRYGNDNMLVKIPLQLVKLLFQRAKKDGMFALALVTYLITWIYIVMNAHNVWALLAAGD